jgi:hypothetical protein
VTGIVLSICICKGKLGGCGSSGMPKEKAVARKVVLVCCGLIIGYAKMNLCVYRVIENV